MHKKDAVVPHRQLCTNYPDGFTYHLTAALSLCHVESAFDYAKFLPRLFVRLVHLISTEAPILSAYSPKSKSLFCGTPTIFQNFHRIFMVPIDKQQILCYDKVRMV